MIGQFSEQAKVLLVISHDIKFITMICSGVLLLSGGTMISGLRGRRKEQIEDHLCVGGYRNE